MVTFSPAVDILLSQGPSNTLVLIWRDEAQVSRARKTKTRVL